MNGITTKQVQRRGKKYCIVCKGGRDFRTFHPIPKDSNRREDWLKAIGLQETELPKCPFVCQSHFQQSDYYVREHPEAQRRLLKTAVPSQNLRRRSSEQNSSALQKCEKSKYDACIESVSDLEKKPETTCSDEPIKEAFDNKELLVKVDATVDFWAMTNDFNTRDVKTDVNEIGIVVNGNPSKIDPLNVSPRSKGAMEQKQSLKTHEDVKPKATRRNANTRVQIEVVGPGYSFREKYEYMSIYVNMMKNFGMKYGAEDHQQFLERSRKITEIIQSIDEEDCVKLVFLAGLTEKETEICLNSNVNNVNAWVDILCDQNHCFESPLTPGDDLTLELEYDSKSDKALSWDSSTGKQSDSGVSIRTKQIPRRKQTFQIRDEFQPTSRRDQPTQRPNIVASMDPSSIDPPN